MQESEEWTNRDAKKRIIRRKKERGMYKKKKRIKRVNRKKEIRDEWEVAKRSWGR